VLQLCSLLSCDYPLYLYYALYCTVAMFYTVAMLYTAILYGVALILKCKSTVGYYVWLHANVLTPASHLSPAFTGQALTLLANIRLGQKVVDTDKHASLQ
jgi:hypothetical protein